MPGAIIPLLATYKILLYTLVGVNSTCAAAPKGSAQNCHFGYGYGPKVGLPQRSTLPLFAKRCQDPTVCALAFASPGARLDATCCNRSRKASAISPKTCVNVSRSFSSADLVIPTMISRDWWSRL